MDSFLLKRLLLAGVAIFFMTQLSLAQTITVQGRVSSDGNPDGLTGVTVAVAGTTNATSTDNTGAYELKNVAPRATLVFTSVGFKERSEPVNNRTSISIRLEEDVASLDQVVVIGYGTARKKDVTGAVASVQTAELEKEAPRSVQDLLRGNAAGLIIGQGNSAKADATLLIRGNGTLKAANSPLHVVDGVIFDGALSDLNPNDIQSIDILKDASAAAVFGAKSANGVVLITTKKGASGTPRISANANVGWAENARMPRVLTAEEFLQYRYDYEMGRRADSYHQQYPEMFRDPKKLENVNPLDWYNYDQQTPVTSVTDEQLTTAWLSRLELKVLK